jgi:hypothetical protein
MITKRTKLMLLVLVAVAIGAYAYLYWWSKTPVHGFLDGIEGVRQVSERASNAVIGSRGNTPAAQSGENTVLPPAMTFKTYENTEIGFSFSYPDTWVPSATRIDEGTDVCLIESGATGGCLATVSFEDVSVNMNEDIALEALRADLRAGRITESSRSVAGDEGTLLRVSGYPAGEENSTRAVVFTHENRVFVIEAALGQEAVFDRIVSTFRFQD